MNFSRSLRYGVSGAVALAGTVVMVSCGLAAGDGQGVTGGAFSTGGAGATGFGGSAGVAPTGGSSAGGVPGSGATPGQAGVANAGGSSGFSASGSSSGGRSQGGGGTTSGGTTSGGGGNQNTGGSLPPIQGGCDGYATRFWDCCKPHCGWPGNVPGGVNAMKSCNRADDNVVNADTGSSCSGGGAYTCHDLSPWAVSGNIAYGFAATSSGDVCGRCYQLQFKGTSHNAGNDPGSAALAGKSMIVQAINVGFDVGGGQFDILVPGGGVGMFNACSDQWGVSNTELGAQYGGLLAACKAMHGNNHAPLKQCMLDKCTSVFQSRGLTDLATGCRWFVDWFQAADNPALTYKEVPCPQEIYNKSGMNRNGRNDIRTSCN